MNYLRTEIGGVFVGEMFLLGHGKATASSGVTVSELRITDLFLILKAASHSQDQIKTILRHIEIKTLHRFVCRATISPHVTV